MAANSSLSLTSLDFDTIKGNLKTFLKSQSVFKDYDFEGSNINVLLDVLSYNTYLNSFYLNMVAAESFLDSAQLRSSVVSHAKELNYTPFSAKSATAQVDITFSTSGITNYFEIPKGTLFSGANANGSYSFATNKTEIITSTNSTFTVNNLEIYEGSYYNESFIVDYTIENQKFVMSNKGIDTGSISLYISEDNAVTVTEYTKVDNLYDITKNSTIFFVQATLDGYYELMFGDGVSFGNRPKNNAVLLVSYRVTNGDMGNGVSNFTIDQNLGTYNGGTASATIITTSASSGGAPEEDIESIRFRAPRHYQTQNRAVTADDYKTIIFDNFGDIEDIHVYGGETIPGSVDYGKVFISISSMSGAALSDQIKADIMYLLDQKRVLSIQPVLIDPDFIYVIPNINVSVNFRDTNLVPAQFSTIVKNAVSKFNDDHLKRFNTTMRYSRLIETINDSNDGILGNETTIQVYKSASPTIRFPRAVNYSFNNALVPSSIISSKFLLDDGKVYQFTDYNPGNDTFTKKLVGSKLIFDNATPNIYLKEISTKNIQNYTVVGTINYATGSISIQNLTYIDFMNNRGIQLFADTVHDDIYSKLNDVIEIDTSNIQVTITSV